MSPRKRRAQGGVEAIELPEGKEGTVTIDGKEVTLTNLDKPFWKKLKITKRDLLAYYASVSPWLLPHLANRAMVMKRYPDGAAGPFFFMKRVPTPHPKWIETCVIPHPKAGDVPFPMVQDLASLLWIINLGCIDLNPWYSRCDDTDRPDVLNFDLDPGVGASFGKVLETALLLRETLMALKMDPLVKTSGSSGLHVYVPIKREPVQKEVWTVAKTIALQLAIARPDLITAEYRIAKRPRGRVLVDYNQNAWGRTLASIYSVRPTPVASVSMPVTWKEVDKGFAIRDFTIRNAAGRLARVGDLWEPLLASKGRFNLSRWV
jgi:bifunctional non-homologous end joining protein LigD